MHAEHVTRAARDRGDLVDIEIGGVARHDRARLADAVELREDLLLHLHQFEHRLDHEIAIGQIIERKARRDQRHAFFDILHGKPPAFGGVLVVLADGGEPAIKRILLRLDDGDGDAGIEEVHRNAAAHGPGADHADAGDFAGGGVLGDIRNLGRLALGEERVALRRRLLAGDELFEQCALEFEPLLEGLFHGGLHGLDAGLGGLEAAELAGILLAEIVKDLRLAACGRDRLVEITHLFERCTGGENLTGEGDGLLAQIAFRDELVEQTHSRRVLCRHMRARGNHLERLLDTDDARQALRATRTWQEFQA